jgi:hypothetical protein
MSKFNLYNVGETHRISIENCIKGFADRSTIRLQHVDKGKLNKCILNTSLDTVLCWIQYIARHNNVVHIVIGWIHCILDICLVLLFQVLNMPFEYVKFPWSFCKKCIKIGQKNKKVQILEFGFCLPLSIEFISVTIIDREYLSTCYWKFPVQLI